MTDIAELGLAIRSDGVVVAADRLNRLSGASAKAENLMGRLTAAALKVAAAYGTWRVAEAIIGKFVSSTIEAERAQNRLAAVIKATGGAAGLTAPQISKMATELQRVTTFGDEAIIGAQTLLLTFRNIGGDVFPRATEAVLDLATTLGTDLNSAAIQLGKALNDPIAGITALNRAGVTFTASQKDMIQSLVESGDGAEAQKVILAELEKQMGGTARAARGTLGGALTALQEAFGDLFEATGPESEKLRKEVERLIDVITDPQFIASVQSLGAALLSAFSNALPAIIEIINRVTRFFQEMDARANDPVLSKMRDAGTPERAKDWLAQNLRNHQYQMAGPGVFGMSMEDFFKPFNTPASTPGDTGGNTGFGLTPDQISAAEQAKKAYDALIKSTEQRIATTAKETEVLGLSITEGEKQLTLHKLMTDAENTGIELTEPRIEQLKRLAEQTSETNMAYEGMLITIENRSPWDTMAEQIQRLNDLMAEGTITAKEYWAEVGKAAEDMVGKYASAANGILGQVETLTDALGLEGKKAFEVEKAISIAKAVVAGGEAIVKSYNWGTTLGGPVGGAAAAALAAAATAAQIAAIASTSYNSKSMSAAASSGGSTSAPAQTTPQTGTNITLVGNRDSATTLGNVEDLLKSLNEHLGLEGKELTINYVNG